MINKAALYKTAGVAFIGVGIYLIAKGNALDDITERVTKFTKDVAKDIIDAEFEIIEES